MKNLTLIIAASLLALPAFAGPAPAPAIGSAAAKAPARGTVAPRPAPRAPIGASGAQVGARSSTTTAGTTAVQIGSAANRQGNQSALAPASRGTINNAAGSRKVTPAATTATAPAEGKDIFGASCSVQAKGSIDPQLQAAVLASNDVAGVTCKESMSKGAQAVLTKAVTAMKSARGAEAKVNASARVIQEARPGISNAEARDAVKGVFCQTPGHQPCAPATASSGICAIL